MKAKFGDSTEVALTKGEAGVFEVEVDGQLVFSKKETGRFPHYQEVPLAITMAGLAPEA